MRFVICLIGGAMALFVLYALTRPDTPEARDRRVHKMAIESCWEDQRRKSIGPAEARFIAGACERMEADFKAKYRQSP